MYSPHLSTATDARAVRTREALRTAFLQLLQTESLEGITIRDICAKANVGYTTFFRHHPTKESLLQDVASEEIKQLLGLAFPLLGSSDTRTACEALCDYVDERRELWSTLLTGGASAALRAEFQAQALRIANEETQRSKWLPADIAAILSVGSTVELLAWWLRQEQPAPKAFIAEILDRVIVTPVIQHDSAPQKASPPTKRKGSSQRGGRRKK